MDGSWGGVGLGDGNVRIWGGDERALWLKEAEESKTTGFGEGWIFGRVLELGAKIRPGSTQAGTGSIVYYGIYMSTHFHGKS
jgi:hypothetical protein